MTKILSIALIFVVFMFFNCKEHSITNQKEPIDLTYNNSIETFDPTNQEFSILGLSFSPNNSTVYLFKAEDETFNLVDSTSVINSKFKFKGSATTPSIYRISETRNKNKGYNILVDNSEIHVFLNKRVDLSSVYSTSTLQKDYLEYNSKMTAFKDKGMALYYGLKGNFSSENIKNLKKQRLALFTEQNDFIESFIKEHSNSYLAAIITKENINTYNAKTLRALHNGFSNEVKNMDYTKSLDSLIVEKETKTKAQLPVVAVKKIEENYNGEYRPKAYKISGLNPYGEAISLKSIPKGKVVLVDFWASWCAPCRATNPNLVALHKKYKDAGFEILSVSEDKGEAEWLNAIAEDDLTWDYHIIDKNKSIAFRYGVESIPFKLLIDKQGNIASEKISGRALETRIKQLLAE